MTTMLPYTLGHGGSFVDCSPALYLARSVLSTLEIVNGSCIFGPVCSKLYNSQEGPRNSVRIPRASCFEKPIVEQEGEERSRMGPQNVLSRPSHAQVLEQGYVSWSFDLGEPKVVELSL